MNTTQFKRDSRTTYVVSKAQGSKIVHNVKHT